MNFKLDENMPADLEKLLKKHGHNAATVHEENLSGSPDATVLKAALKENRILITFDLDFADVRTYPPRSHHGIIVFRLADQRWQTMRLLAEEMIERMDFSALEGALAIVEPRRVRYRRANQ